MKAKRIKKCLLGKADASVGEEVEAYGDKKIKRREERANLNKYHNQFLSAYFQKVKLLV